MWFLYNDAKSKFKNSIDVCNYVYKTVTQRLGLQYLDEVRREYDKSNIVDVTFEMYYMMSKLQFPRYDYLMGTTKHIINKVFNK